MKSHRGFASSIIMVIPGMLAAVPVAVGENARQSSPVVQYGKMHEVIGQQQHEGRVRFSELLKRPHFYGVGALEGLKGEATIFDGKVTLTTVDSRGRLRTDEAASVGQQATLLFGAYVPSWTDYVVPENVDAEAFDGFIADAAQKAGVNVDKPFLFTVAGDFTDVRLHVINGACPIRARLKKLDLPEEVRPFESDMPKISGTVVGIFAKDAVGNMTHPATSTHIHLLFKDAASGKTVTGHLEQIGLRKGAVLRFAR